MLDIKVIRENRSLVESSIKNRGLKLDLDNLIKIDDQRRKILSTLEELRRQQNQANDEISKLLKEKTPKTK